MNIIYRCDIIVLGTKPKKELTTKVESISFCGFYFWRFK